MSKKTAQRTRNGSMNALKGRIHEIKPLFEIDDNTEFAISDLDVENPMQFKSVLDLCRHKGALDKVGTRLDERNNVSKKRKLNVYQWDPQIRAKLKAHYEEQTTLQCGHRVHIYNSPEVPEDKLSCRYCAEEGEYPEYEKDTVRELL